MRYKSEHYENNWFETDKQIEGRLPEVCLKCVIEIGKLPNTYGNSKIKRLIDFEMKTKYGLNRWLNLKLCYGLRF